MTTEIDDASDTARAMHLLDGRPVYIPYAHAGHFRRTQPEASPEIDTFIGLSRKPHPYNHRTVAVVELAGPCRAFVNLDRLAHDRSCTDCALTWTTLDRRLSEIPADAGLTAAVQVETANGLAYMYVDVDDLPDDYFTPESE